MLQVRSLWRSGSGSVAMASLKAARTHNRTSNLRQHMRFRVSCRRGTQRHQSLTRKANQWRLIKQTYRSCHQRTNLEISWRKKSRKLTRRPTPHLTHKATMVTKKRQSERKVISGRSKAIHCPSDIMLTANDVNRTSESTAHSREKGGQQSPKNEAADSPSLNS